MDAKTILKNLSFTALQIVDIPATRVAKIYELEVKCRNISIPMERPKHLRESPQHP